jgi:hypothetical protein
MDRSCHPRWAITLGVAAAVCTSVFGAAGAPAARAAREPHDLLRAVGGFSAGQLAALDRGEALAKVLSTERREIAIVGAVRIHAPRERMLERYRDVSNLRKSQIVLQSGLFGRSPGPDDLAALSLDPYDLEAPKDCRPGDCAVRLSAADIARMHRTVDWTARDATEQAAVAWRHVLADVASGYAKGGDAALPEYANKKDPLRVQDELNALYDQFRYFSNAVPEFFRHVREYPRAPLNGADQLLYWSKADLGIRPVVTITHQIIYAPPGRDALIATKRIYAAHYVDGALGVTMLTDDRAGGFYMTTVERVRTRSLTSFSRAIVRSIVQGQSRDGVEKMLKSSKRSLEAAHVSGGQSPAPAPHLR